MRCPRSPGRFVLLLSSLLSLAACEAQRPPPSGIADTLGGISFEVPPGTPAGSVDAGAPRGPSARGAAFPPETYGGRSPFRTTRAGTSGTQRVAGGVQVNFDGADVREVVKVILGDILGATYTIDPTISGQVVLSSAAPLSEGDLIRVLETVLAMHGGALVKIGDNAYAVRLTEEVGAGGAEVAGIGGGGPIRTMPGTGVTIVPLNYISASSAAQFIQPLVTAPEQIRIDEGRNLLLFVGSGGERTNVLETLRDLDVNWMAGRSIGIFPLAVATPEAIIPELESLFTPLSAPDLGAGTIRFLPVARLNAVLAVGQGQQQIQEVARWVERLDRGSQQDVQFFVYQLQHAPAAEVAQILGESLSEGGGGIATGGGVGLGGTSSGLGLGGSQLGADPTASGGFDGSDGSDGGVDFGGSDQGGIGSQTGQDLVPGEQNRSGVQVQGVGGNLRTGGGVLGDLGPVRIVPNSRNNTLLVRATPRAYEYIEATLRRLDTAPLQVLIEATIAEVVLNDTLRYGVQYFLESGDVRAGFNTNSLFGLTGAVAQVPGFNFLFAGGDTKVAIDALSRVSDVRVLSSPSVVVQDNRLATLSVGDQVPIVTRTAQSLDSDLNTLLNNIEYRDTGVILKVRPRISSNDNVALEIGQEVSRVVEGTTTADVPSPTISQRRITSEVNVLSGQTVVLGGLIQDSETVAKDKVPLLGDIPVLGNLFRSNNNVSVRTELIVFLTPQIIRNAADARDVSEELRDRMLSLRPRGTAARTLDQRPRTLPPSLPETQAPRRLPAPAQPLAPGVGTEPLPAPGPGASLEDVPGAPAALPAGALGQGTGEAAIAALVGNAAPLPDPTPPPIPKAASVLLQPSPRPAPAGAAVLDAAALLGEGGLTMPIPAPKPALAGLRPVARPEGPYYAFL
ncbi:MAG: type II secretion system secretin GspD [Geminicoccaceae bacterium]|nr:type II secretion system secretin GspD [Geminicoccaceae bacterium]